jgi:hypothetical protein
MLHAPSLILAEVTGVRITDATLRVATRIRTDRAPPAPPDRAESGGPYRWLEHSAFQPRIGERAVLFPERDPGASGLGLPILKLDAVLHAVGCRPGWLYDVSRRVPRVPVSGVNQASDMVVT